MGVPKYCEKCGWMKIANELPTACPICKTELKLSDLDNLVFANMSRTEEDAYILSRSKTGEYDAYWAEKRIDTMRRDREECIERTNAYAAAHPECPYCKSRNTKKLSAGARLISTGFFGLGSKKIGKQWHCLNCSSDF